MLSAIIDCIFGTCTIKCEGSFPERILNTASNKGIYIQNVSRNEDGNLIFNVSRRGYSYLEKNIPEGLSVSVERNFGLPFFFKRYKKRLVLILLPIIFLSAAMLYSSFVWKVKITGGNTVLKKEVLSALKENGVYKGAIKHKIDQTDVKYKTLISVDELSWLWVDIKGTTAYVDIRPRTNIPNMFEIKEPADVIATDSGVVEKAEVYCGRPLISEGMTVKKGDLLVTGEISTDNENIPTYYHHANARIIVRTWKEKSYIIPKKTYIKTPTGNEKTVYSVNFKKNNVKFSLNSGISYDEYVKIEKKTKLPFLSVTVLREKYQEVNVTAADNDIEKAVSEHIEAFTEELKEKNYEVLSVNCSRLDSAENIRLTVTAECLKNTAKEVPINPIDKGEADG